MEGTHYPICVFHGGTLRMYYMDKLGKMLGAEEFAGAEMEKVQGKILKGTKRMFSFAA